MYNVSYGEVCHCVPSGIGTHLRRNRLRVRFLAVSDTYPMFIGPTITRVPSGSIGTCGLIQKLC